MSTVSKTSRPRRPPVRWPTSLINWPNIFTDVNRALDRWAKYDFSPLQSLVENSIELASVEEVYETEKRRGVKKGVAGQALREGRLLLDQLKQEPEGDDYDVVADLCYRVLALQEALVRFRADGLSPTGHAHSGPYTRSSRLILLRRILEELRSNPDLTLVHCKIVIDLLLLAIHEPDHNIQSTNTASALETALLRCKLPSDGASRAEWDKCWFRLQAVVREQHFDLRSARIRRRCTVMSLGAQNLVGQNLLTRRQALRYNVDREMFVRSHGFTE